MGFLRLRCERTGEPSLFFSHRVDNRFPPEIRAKIESLVNPCKLVEVITGTAETLILNPEGSDSDGFGTPSTSKSSANDPPV